MSVFSARLMKLDNRQLSGERFLWASLLQMSFIIYLILLQLA